MTILCPDEFEEKKGKMGGALAQPRIMTRTSFLVAGLQGGKGHQVVRILVAVCEGARLPNS